MTRITLPTVRTLKDIVDGLDLVFEGQIPRERIEAFINHMNKTEKAGRTTYWYDLAMELVDWDMSQHPFIVSRLQTLPC